MFIAFDVLSRDDDVLMELPYLERRAALEDLVEAPVELTPMVRTPEEAEHWLQEAEGVIAKEAAAVYKPGERVGMVKIKRVRTIDAVVLGWRPGKAENTVGALILGLYGEDGRLREVGHSSGFTAKEKRELVGKLAPYETGERGTGEPSRWSMGRDLAWVDAPPGARRRDHVRPRLERPDPPRGEGPALARRQAAARVPDVSARQLRRAQRDRRAGQRDRDRARERRRAPRGRGDAEQDRHPERRADLRGGVQQRRCHALARPARPRRCPPSSRPPTRSRG